MEAKRENGAADAAVKTEKKKPKRAYSITVKPNKKGRHIIGFINFLRVLVLPIFSQIVLHLKMIADGY